MNVRPNGDAGAPAKRVLVVDDEPQIRDILELSLRHLGFAILTLADGVQALRTIPQWRPDAILLDVMMPKIDGIALLPKIRGLTEAPILMLTAKGELNDRGAAFNAGADDYIVKPFEVEDVVWRLESALRRPRLEKPAGFSYRDLHVDVERHVVTRAGRKIALTAQEYKVLALLIRHPEQVFSREQILDLVWDDRAVSPAVAERYISFLRAKIDHGFDQPLIVTVRNLGYCLRGR